MCPTINRREIKPKKVKYKHEKKEFYADKYNSIAWKNLRNTYISQFPLCQCCLLFNRVTPAEHVHHKRFWSTGETEEEQWKLFLDWNNLQSLCADCHVKIHNKARQYGLTFCDTLTEREYYDKEYER